MWTINIPFEVDDKVLNRNMANDSGKAKMKTSGEGHTQM